MSTREKPVRFDTLQGTLDSILAAFEPDRSSDAPVAAQKAAHLAQILQDRAASLQTPQRMMTR